ncbi:MAG: GNAT family N-acetyltransferase [Methanobacteriota archaeon]
MSSLKIRRMTIADYDAVVELWKKAGLSYRPDGRDSPERVGRELGMPMAVFLVAEEGGKIIGVIFGTQDGRKMYVNRLAVHPGSRRKGVAAALVRELERLADEMGLLLVTALVEDENTPSLAFMESMGYVRHNDITYFSKRKDKDA